MKKKKIKSIYLLIFILEIWSMGCVALCGCLFCCTSFANMRCFGWKIIIIFLNWDFCTYTYLHDVPNIPFSFSFQWKKIPSIIVIIFYSAKYRHKHLSRAFFHYNFSSHPRKNWIRTIFIWMMKNYSAFFLHCCFFPGVFFMDNFFALFF